jgi:hypothetical protein
MQDTILWHIGDGLMPAPVRNTLYKSWYKTETVDLNGWSFMHALSGFVFATLFPNQTIWMWIFIHTVWEIYQILIGMTDLLGDPVSESVDIIFDTIFACLGFWIANLHVR